MTRLWPPEVVRHALLTVGEMAEADRRTIASGVSGETLMERAGSAVACVAMKDRPLGRVTVLCGPGGNGGDGFVAARLLSERGWPVRVGVFGRKAMKGDSLRMAGRWKGDIETPDNGLVDEADLVIDAVFGAGLARDLDTATLELLGRIRAPVIAVDVPSGVDGNTGGIRGGAVTARATVTFCRRKPGHLLMPGRALSGDVLVEDIGITDATVAGIGPAVMQNGPDLWLDRWPWPDLDAHKHNRGHLVVGGGGIESSGAARLAAAAGLRIGAGLVTCAMPRSALIAYAAHQTAVMNHALARIDDFARLMAQERVCAAVLGPGAGTGCWTRGLVATVLATGKPVVLDADALTAFRESRSTLMGKLHHRCVLTPHEGEFRRLFERTGDRLRDVGTAAREAGCVVLLKGPDTVIADHEGRFVVNANGTPFLATAGSGDILAGSIGGLLAQGAAPFDAAAMGCWLHAEAGSRSGPGLVAEDLPELMVPVLHELYREVPRALAAPAVRRY